MERVKVAVVFCGRTSVFAAAGSDGGHYLYPTKKLKRQTKLERGVLNNLGDQVAAERILGAPRVHLPEFRDAAESWRSAVKEAIRREIETMQLLMWPNVEIYIEGLPPATKRIIPIERTWLRKTAYRLFVEHGATVVPHMNSILHCPCGYVGKRSHYRCLECKREKGSGLAAAEWLLSQMESAHYQSVPVVRQGAEND